MACPNSARQKKVTIGFRCSPEDAALIDRLVAMSGMTKQDYIMAKLSDHEITATPNVRMLKGLQDAAKDIFLELRRIRKGSEINAETEAAITALVGILKDLGAYDEDEVSDTEQEAMDIMNMARG